MDALLLVGARRSVRWVMRQDLPAILEIERASFPDPWDEGRLVEVLRRQNVAALAADSVGRVVGYLVYELAPGGIEVLRLAVDPDCRRQGVGRQLLAKLVPKLHPHRRRQIGLHVRETNLAGQHFLAAGGFRATGVVRGYFEADTGEDSYRFVLGWPRGDRN
jgi:ribosomal-protein-alanine N-acetyltransferase